MDPNTTLHQLRELVTDYYLARDVGIERDLAGEMAEAFKSLDDWLSKGGFPPEAWEDAQFERPKNHPGLDARREALDALFPSPAEVRRG